MTTTLIILVITVALFIWGRVRADIVALTALAALLVLGILTPAEALAGFSSPIVIMMIGLFVVGGAIMQTGLAKLTGNKLMALSRGNETITFLLVMLVTSFIGAFVSNTGTVALMMPIIMSIAAGSGMQQAEVGVKLTRQQARFIALGQYLDLYKIDNRIKVYEKNIELTRQLIADIKAKQAQGMALKNDITRYELQMESLKLGLTSLRNNRSILNHQLLNTLGMNQEDKGEQEMQIIPDATIADKAYAKDGEAYWQTASTMNSPLLEQSSNAIRIAEQKEKIAKSDLLPK
jgi:hypothetical protein